MTIDMVARIPGSIIFPRMPKAEYQFEADFHGETLYYIEAGRKVGIDWTWTNGYKIYPGSIGYWTNADGTRTLVSDAERETIVQRAAKYAQEVQGVKLIIE